MSDGDITMPPIAAVRPRKLDEQSAQEFALEMTKLHLRQEMARAQLIQSESANKLRRVHPNYNVGNLVYVSTRNWDTTRPTKKLDYRFAGPYQILSRIGDDAAVTYKLELPDSLGLRNRDNAFHASLLQPATDAEGPLTGQVQEPPLPIEVLCYGDDEAEKEYEVEQILDSKVRNQRGRVKAGQPRRTRVEYLVQWKGHPNPTWEKQESLRGAPKMIADYYNKGTAVEPMPDELKSLLSIQDESSSAQLFLTAPGVQSHYIHGSRAQSLYPNMGRTAYATDSTGQQHSTVGAPQQPYDGSFCLAPTLVDHRAPSSAASLPTAGQQCLPTT
jgi:hypothetical protein